MAERGVGDMRVVVAGDVTMDWNLARVGDLFRSGSSKEAMVQASFEPGGASILTELISAVAAEVSETQGVGIEVVSPGVPTDTVSPVDDRFPHSYALWSPFELEGKGQAWRIEEFLGFDRALTPPQSQAVGTTSGSADLVILDDAGLGFRDRPELWPGALGLSAEASPWILLKMAKPVAQGPLWERLQAAAERVIAVIRIDDLRLSDVHISRGLSWERTAQDLMWELLYNHRVSGLARCAHVVVSFSTAGALLLSSTGSGGPEPTYRCSLVFDPKVMEDMWIEELPGRMMGYTRCLTAAIARQLMLAPDAPDLSLGIHRGLAAMRSLHLHGYEERTPASSRAGLGFPLGRIVDVIGHSARPFAEAAVRDPAASLPGRTDRAKTAEPRHWTILQDRYPGGLEQLAWRVVLEGTEETLRDLPLGQFGKLLTVDRHEMEGYRSVRTLIREYAQQRRPERPLSIAVFGPPGAGKSFGIKEVARSVLPGRISVLTFNLSQFDNPPELLDALHQVRDASLSGFLPLVFWDEFDTALAGRPLGWLRHFLSPMQDGSFQDGQIIHPIGPAVFVFAGGTRERIQDFASQDEPAFRDAKGPDFVSRLKGYVNVLGPNPRDADAAADPHYLLRRAILLRTMLQRDAAHLLGKEDGKKILQIDPGVLRAFLLTRTYKHGTRSLESIIAMSTLSAMTRFERSCLPAEAQLDIHVEAASFLDLVQRLDLEGEVLERLAEANHLIFCAARLSEGKSWGEESDDYLQRHPLLAPFAGRKRDAANTQPTLVAYERLSEGDKEQNRGLVRDIPNKLATGGYAMRPARSGDPPVELPEEVVERLAEAEHERWMRAKLAAAWSWGSQTIKEARLHRDILPWRELSDEECMERYGEWAQRVGKGELPDAEKEKDRELIQGIAFILAVSGYVVAKVRAASG